MEPTPASASGAEAAGVLTAAEIVKRVKWNGCFDQFRKDCLADKSSQPLFNDLEKLVQDYVQKYVSEQTWNSQLKRLDIRDKIIKRLNENYHITKAVNSITDSVVSSKIELSFRPIIDKIADDWENNVNKKTSTAASAALRAPSGESARDKQSSTSAKPTTSASSSTSIKVEDFLPAKENSAVSSVAKPASKDPSDKIVKKPVPAGGAKETLAKTGPSATPGSIKLPSSKPGTSNTPTTSKPSSASVKTEHSKPTATTSKPPSNVPAKTLHPDAKKLLKPAVKGSSTSNSTTKPSSSKPASSAASSSSKPTTSKQPTTTAASKPSDKSLLERDTKFVLEPDPSKEYNYNWRLNLKTLENESSLWDDISVSSVSDSDLTDYEIIREIEEDEKALADTEKSKTEPEVVKDAEGEPDVSKNTEMAAEASEEKKPDDTVSESTGSSVSAEKSVKKEPGDQASHEPSPDV